MGRFDHKLKSSSRCSATKLVILISIAGLLGAALITDFLYASSSSFSSSSSSAYLSVASNWALEKSGIIFIPSEDRTDKASKVGSVDSVLHYL